MSDGRLYLVADNGSGIPYRGQDYMTRQECEEWIAHDIKECHACGLTDITRADYDIIKLKEG